MCAILYFCDLRGTRFALSTGPFGVNGPRLRTYFLEGIWLIQFVDYKSILSKSLVYSLELPKLLKGKDIRVNLLCRKKLSKTRFELTTIQINLKRIVNIANFIFQLLIPLDIRCKIRKLPSSNMTILNRIYSLSDFEMWSEMSHMTRNLNFRSNLFRLQNSSKIDLRLPRIFNMRFIPSSLPTKAIFKFLIISLFTFTNCKQIHFLVIYSTYKSICIFLFLLLQLSCYIFF